MVGLLGDLEKGSKFANKGWKNKNKKKIRDLKSGQIVTLGTASFQFANNNLYRIKKNGELAKEPISKNTLTYKNIMNPNNPRVQTGKGGKTNKAANQAMLAIVLQATGKKNLGLKLAENKNSNNKSNNNKVKASLNKKPTGADSWKNYKTVAAAQKAKSRFFMGSDGKKKLAVTKEQLKKTGLSLREFANRKTKVKASKGGSVKR